MSTLSLQHLVHNPTVPESGKPPLLLLLHGIGSNERDLFGLAPELDGRFLTLSLRAPIAVASGSFAWYHMEPTAAGFVINSEEAEASRRAVLQFVDEAVDAYQADPKRVYLTGFSQGGIISLAAALTEPKKFAGVVAMSSRILPNLMPKVAHNSELRGFPVLVLHGTFDNVIPIHYGRDIAAGLRKLPLDLEYIEYPMAHTVSEASLLDVKRWLKRQLDTRVQVSGAGR